MKLFIAILATVTIASAPCWAQAPSPQSGASAESADLTYHFTVMMPQYRFLDTSGNPSRAGEYDSLQQSVGGELSLSLVEIPQHLSLKSTADFVSRDDYDVKSRFTLGKWFDFTLDNRSFVRHLDNNFSDGIGHNGFYADLISPDIIRTDSIPVDALLGVRRRINSAQARVQLPDIPVKLFVKGGWQARDGTSQMQYYDMGGSGDPATDLASGCANCHSASQYRSLNYTTRNIAGGAEVTLGKVAKLVYQHEFRSFNDRMQNPVDYFGTAGFTEENIPDSALGSYVHSVLPRSQTQSDSLQITMAVAHHVTLNGDLSYARTVDLAASYTVPATPTNGVHADHQQNALNGDVTLTWHPVSPLRVIADFHQQNLLNDFVQTYTLSPTDTYIYTFGNPSLHRHWGGLKLQYRLSKQFDVETYYKRLNVTRSNSQLWPHGAPFSADFDNYDPLLVVPATFSNIAGVAFRFHSDRLWNARTGYEWTGTHNPGYVTDPHTNHHVFGDVTITPMEWFSIGNDANIVLQQSFPLIQRSNHLYTDTTFLTVRPVPEWTVGGSFSYLQDNLRTDMRLLNDAGIALYTQPLVPYKEVDQSYSFRTTYAAKKRFGVGIDFARSLAHSGWRPDVNPADYPQENSANAWTPPLCSTPPCLPFNPDGSYGTYTDFLNGFGSALALGSGVASQVKVPQTIVASTADYRFGRGFNGGFRFNYGSYANRVNTTYTSPLFNYQPMAFSRADLNGIVRSYTVFVGRVW